MQRTVWMTPLNYVFKASFLKFLGLYFLTVDLLDFSNKELRHLKIRSSYNYLLKK